MTGRTQNRVRSQILSLYPTTRGFGFALFDSERRLLDWGSVGVRGDNKNVETMRQMALLIARTHATKITTEDTRPKSARRHDRIRRLHALLIAEAHVRHIPLLRFTRAEVLRYFGATTKYELAKTVAGALPHLAHRLPPRRKPWMSEDTRQSLFDAAALGLMAFRR